MMGPVRLVDHVELHLPRLPEELEGLRVAHLTDLHITRPRLRGRHRRIVAELAHVDADLLLLTGDYMSNPGDEPAAVAVLKALLDQVRAKLGVFGVFGNHDTDDFRAACGDLPVQWLGGRCRRLAQGKVELLGLDTGVDNVGSDSLALVKHWLNTHEAAPTGQVNGGGRAIRLLLAHMPESLPTAGDLRIDVMFAGHTHGGQCRLPRRRALVNSTRMPLHLSSGVLRHQETLCVVSRGLGEVGLPLRVFCPPHLPVFTLRRGPLSGRPTHWVENLRPW